MRLNVVLMILAGLVVFAACQNKKAQADEEVVEVDPQALVDGNYQVDQASVKWTGKKLKGLDKHYGFIQMTEGSFVVAEGNISAGAGFVLDAQTIVSEDLKDDPENAAKLQGHLKSADFFDAENYPNITFVISSVSKDSTGYEVTGDLNIKDSTQSITFPAAITQQGDTLNVEAAFTFDRTQFDVVYGSSSIFDIVADKAISDEIEIELKLSALREAQTEAPAEEATEASDSETEEAK